MSHKASGAKKLPLPPLPPRRAEFFLQPRFTNTPPDVPFPPKFIPAPFVSLQRLVDYKMSSGIEQDARPEVILGENMGLKIDLVDLSKYDADKVDADKVEKPLNSKDELLLAEEIVMTPKMKRSAQHSKVVTWMRKTEYISAESTRYGSDASRLENKLGYNLLKNKKPGDELYRDRQKQINAINKTFEDVRKPVREHFKEKGVVAVSEEFIFPDFANWKFEFCAVRFDSDPIPEEIEEAGHLKTAQENCILRGMSVENKKFTALFVPTMDTVESFAGIPPKSRSIPDFPCSYQLQREYSRRLAFKDRDVFAIYQRDNQWCYNPIDTRMKLTRNLKMNLSKKSMMEITYRPWDAKETAELDQRLANLHLQPKDLEDREQKESQKKARGNDDARESSNGKAQHKAKESIAKMSSNVKPQKKK